MTITSALRILLFMLCAGAMVPAMAQQAARKAPDRLPAEHSAAAPGVLRLLPGDSVTEHAIDTTQGRLAYQATAGTLAFFNQSGEQSASIFYTAYVKKNGGANRPLTFVFNGGPGAASAFLNLGLVGPRVLDFGPHGNDAARAELHDNPETWLRFTDLVAIDPIGTGWSRTVKPDDAKHFWSVDGDASAMAKAIALYVAKNNRTGSPIYLMGESYGGLRAAKTATALKREQGIAVSGIVMLSPLLEGWLTFGDDQSALRAALELPTLAAAKLTRTGTLDREALAQAEEFAMHDYLTTLAGPRLQGAAAKAFYERVAQVSGLPLDVVTKARGFVTDAFVKTLRDGKIVSRYDANFAVDDPHPAARAAHGADPILDGVARAYGGAFVSYARNELGFKTAMTYQLLANDVTRHWDWGKGGRSEVGAESDLRTLLAFSPSFRLMIAHGYADMVTPYAATRYVVDHLPPFDPPGRVVLHNYRGGHMLYLDPAERKAFSNDAAAFYRGGE